MGDTIMERGQPMLSLDILVTMDILMPIMAIILLERDLLMLSLDILVTMVMDMVIPMLTMVIITMVRGLLMLRPFMDMAMDMDMDMDTMDKSLKSCKSQCSRVEDYFFL